MVTTAESTGATSRETTVWSAVTTWAAATTGSWARSGMAPWPPWPWTTMRSRSTAPISGPALTPNVPTGSSFQRCTPSTTSTPSRAPSATTAWAPPSPSSAGWKSTRTSPASGRAARMRAATAPIAVWPSWPQACMRPALREAYGTAFCSGMGRASRSTRSSTVRPGPPRATASRPVLATVRRARPLSRRNSATRPAVRVSVQASSGWAWNSRRSATRSSRAASTSADRAGIAAF
jgi:hypothetical protein